MTKTLVTEEPDEGKALMSGSVVAVGRATALPTITERKTLGGCPDDDRRYLLAATSIVRRIRLPGGSQ